MRQAIILEAADLKLLLKGLPIRLHLSDGQVVDLAAERSSAHNGTSPSRPPSSKVPCPYCQKLVAGLGSHIRGMHPGKGLVATGGVKCRFCTKRYPTPHSAARHAVMSHSTQSKAKPEKAKP
jgi:hypothetical protein